MLPTPLLKELSTADGRTVRAVFTAPVQPNSSVTVTTTAAFATVVVGVPDTSPLVAPMLMPAGRPVADHPSVLPVLPLAVKVTGP